jgi:hypothetical protein
MLIFKFLFKLLLVMYERAEITIFNYIYRNACLNSIHSFGAGIKNQ